MTLTASPTELVESVAIPREVLVDPGVVSGAAPEVSFEPSGRRQLKGFPDPVAVLSLVFAPSASKQGEMQR